MADAALTPQFAEILSSLEVHDGSTVVGRDREGRIVVQGRGHWRAEHASVVNDGLERAARASEVPVRVFWDLAGVEHYDGKLRREITDYLVKNYKRFDREHHLVATNSLVAMGASTAGLALSMVGVRVHVTRKLDQFALWYDGPAAPA